MTIGGLLTTDGGLLTTDGGLLTTDGGLLTTGDGLLTTTDGGTNDTSFITSVGAIQLKSTITDLKIPGYGSSLNESLFTFTV